MSEPLTKVTPEVMFSLLVAFALYKFACKPDPEIRVPVTELLLPPKLYHPKFALVW